LKFENIPMDATARNAISRSSYFMAKRPAPRQSYADLVGIDGMSCVAAFAKQLILATTPTKRRSTSSPAGASFQFHSTFAMDDLIRLDAAWRAGYIERGQLVIITGGAPWASPGKRTSSKSIRWIEAKNADVLS
jgi:hypothetical protein